MPRKIREFIRDLMDAGFYEIGGSVKGSHRKFVHVRYRGVVTLSGPATQTRALPSCCNESIGSLLHRIFSGGVRLDDPDAGG
jgi:predicted RNA binding protein YcfA (HicA-like mRNA interferase family)